MNLLLALAALVASSSALDFSEYRPIEDFYLQDPEKYPDFASLVPPAVRTPRIVGGQEAQPGQFPFQAALFITSSDGKGYFCGGSLLNSDYVLTAAHCASAADSIKVVLGAQNVRQSEPSQVEVLVPKANIKVHEKWSTIGIRNDIAVLKLPRSVNSTARIQAVSLPKRSEAGNLFVGDQSTTSGWGKPKDSASTISPELRWVQSVVISNSACQNYYGVNVQSSNICASGKGGKSSCNGDSGGPLTVGSGKDKRQVGIVSFGSALGCSIGFPHAYTRTTSYLDWIQKNTNVVIN